MSKDQIKIYLFTSIIHVAIVLLWRIVYQDNFTNPIFSGITTVLGSQIFFWFGGYAPRITFQIAKERGKLIEQMRSIRTIIFLWFIMFAVAAIAMIISPILNNQIEKAVFFFIPASMSVGAYLCWKYINETLSNTGSI